MLFLASELIESDLIVFHWIWPVSNILCQQYPKASADPTDTMENLLSWDFLGKVIFFLKHLGFTLA